MRRFALIVLLSVFASFLGLDGPGATAPFEKAVPGAPGNAVLAQGSLPPKGRILFVGGAGPKSQTFSIDGDGTNVRQLTNIQSRRQRRPGRLTASKSPSSHTWIRAT